MDNELKQITIPHAATALSIIVPTFNERENISALIEAIKTALTGINWEIIVVDDDSPDETYNLVEQISRYDARVRLVRRVGRRGLSSAVIEGVLNASGDVIGVIDADFQHDENILPVMYREINAQRADIVVGTRYAQGGEVSDWNAARHKMSDVATRLSRLLIGSRTSDPMSGFFLARKALFTNLVYDLSQRGYKILLDLISSAPSTIKIIEVPYKFKGRRMGSSKLDAMVLAEFGFLIIEKLTYGLIPPRLVLFCCVGGLGLILHLSVLFALADISMSFIDAQAIATFCAMVFNFFVNNEFTYRDQRVVGYRILIKLPLFCAICSIGALANVGVAELALQQTQSWTIAGIAGAMMGAVFNFGSASRVVWGAKKAQSSRVAYISHGMSLSGAKREM